MNNIFERIKNYIQENRHFITASILSTLTIITIIFVISLMKDDKKTSSDNSYLSSTTSESEENTDTSSDDTTDKSDETTTGVSDIDFTLPEDATEEEQTTLPVDSYTYLIKVNRILNCVTIYTKDANGEYTVPYKAMTCSTGKVLSYTPLGTFKISSKYDWRLMVDGTQSQYATRFNNGILFHSVPCYTKNYNDLETAEFNKLGSPASLGCVRLTVADSKWIHDNCPAGTKVIVYDDAATPGPLGKPEVIKIPENSPNAGWDPTDPHPDNPWHLCSPSIKASDITVKAGTSLSAVLSSVKATDTCGNDVSQTVNASGNYNLNNPGNYSITFNVTDLLGRSASTTVNLKVVGNSTSSAARPTTGGNHHSSGNIRK